MTTEAETLLLGAVILDPSQLDRIDLDPSCFADPAHAAAWELLTDLQRAGEAIDPRRLAGRLRAAGLLDRLGGAATIARWTMDCPNHRHAPAYAADVRTAADRRKLVRLAADLQDRAADAGEDPAATADWLEGQLVRHRATSRQDACTLASAMRDVIRDIRAARERGRTGGLVSGIADLDNASGGFFGGELVILAARPSIGKSAMGAQIGLHAAQQGEPVLFVSLEMTGGDIATRQLAADLGVEVRSLRQACDLEDSDLEAADRTADATDGIPFHIWDSRRATVDRIRAAARIQAATTGLSMLIVDYIGLIVSTDRRKPRWEAITEISGDLKSLALELQIPILALCQLNREAEGAKGGPKLHHLRESGAIEQDADVVLMLHRDSRDSTEATLAVEKARNGCTGSIQLQFDPSVVRFRSQGGPKDVYEYFA